MITLWKRLFVIQESSYGLGFQFSLGSSKSAVTKLLKARESSVSGLLGSFGLLLLGFLDLRVDSDGLAAVEEFPFTEDLTAASVWFFFISLLVTFQKPA